MPDNAICPRCGMLISSGSCPHCGSHDADTAPPVTNPGGQPGRAYLVIRVLWLVLGLLLYAASRLLLPLIASHSRAANPPGLSPQAQHHGPVASLFELKGHGTIWLVQMGKHQAPYSVADLAAWLHSKYLLDARVLPPESIDESAWDPSRRQYIAELLYAQMKRDHPVQASDPGAWLIGFTDVNMYSVMHHWSGTFSERDEERAAIISSDGMQDRLWWWGRASDRQLANQNLQHRLRRILLKNVALLYWRLNPNNDPTSLLHQPLDPNLPTEDIYESDLNPARTRAGEFEGEPCIFFTYSAKQGLHPLPGSLIRTCSDVHTPLQDESTELFEVDLRLGLLIAKHTDLRLPGAIPIEFERALRDGWSGDNPFGVSGTDRYDSFLSSRDNIFINVVTDEGQQYRLVRVPRWLSDLNWVRYVDTDLSGHFYQMRWHTAPFPHYDLTRYDGNVDTYLPCYSPTVPCYLDGIRNPQGQELSFTRDDQRHLLQLTSPEHNWIKLTYGPENHIARLDDSRGRSVLYGYDDRNQLTTVTYPTGEILRFTFDNSHRILTFSAAPHSGAATTVMLCNQYDNGLLVRQTLADGSVYTYSYGPADAAPARTATVQVSDGRVYNISLNYDSSTVWEQLLPKSD